MHYCCHRFVVLWKYHAKHHELSAKKLNGFNALYCSVQEHICLNMFPVFFAGYLSNLSFLETLLWYCFASYNSVRSHTVDDIASLGYHQYHHEHPNHYFGISLGAFDLGLNYLKSYIINK